MKVVSEDFEAERLFLSTMSKDAHWQLLVQDSTPSTVKRTAELDSDSDSEDDDEAFLPEGKLETDASAIERIQMASVPGE